MKKFTLVTLLGIRPDIIRMHKLIQLLNDGQNRYNYKHIFAHTGQHFDYELDRVFYDELSVPRPDFNFHVGKTLKKQKGLTTHAYQASLLFEKTQEFLDKIKPDAVLFLGDTNSVLASIIVARSRIPVIHIEGGGRSFDWRMPEEKNRVIIDHLSDLIYSYLPRYKSILLSEGISEFRVVVTGNIIVDAINQYSPLAAKRDTLKKFGLKAQGFVLVTLHREENISEKRVLKDKIKDIIKLADDFPVVFPIMPGLQKYLKEYSLLSDINRSKIIQTKPLGFLDFLQLETYAKAIVTDSGTVQEEALILGTPCLVARLSTERPETITAGATILANDKLYEHALETIKMERNWDRTVLNPFDSSPSDLIFNDLIKRIKVGFFPNSRSYQRLKENKFVQEAYGLYKKRS